MGSYEQKITLCWDCANAIGKCPWSKKLVPVKNWVAKRVPFKEQGVKDSFTYAIEQCPLFVRDGVYNGARRFIERKEI